MKKETCLHRITRDCRDCQEDVSPYHHPNNFDCPKYTPVTVRTFEIESQIDKFYRRYPERR